jgi:hypothetical protein
MRRNTFGGGNYPPGAANDPRAPYNQPDRSHEHEWEPTGADGPIFEDGAAIFFDECMYAEGEYDEGWHCEETRSFRCEIERITVVRNDAPDVTYLASEEDHHTKWGHIETVFEDALVGVEMESARFDVFEVLDVDPPNEYGDGFVRVRLGEYIVEYKQ